MRDRMYESNVQYAFLLRLNMLRREHLPQLTMSDFQYAMIHGIWKDKLPRHSSEAIDAIMNVSAEDVVNTLTRLALTEGARINMNDIDDLLEK